MRKKYFVKSDEGWAVAMWWDGEKMTVVVGGYRAMAPNVMKVLDGFFGMKVNNIEMGTVGRRIRMEVKGVDEYEWGLGVERLKKRFVLTKTRTFRRLCR